MFFRDNAPDRARSTTHHSSLPLRSYWLGCRASGAGQAWPQRSGFWLGEQERGRLSVAASIESIHAYSCAFRVPLSDRRSRIEVNSLKSLARPRGIEPYCRVINPAYKSNCPGDCRARTLRTFDNCHWPLRAVRMPRLFNAIARPRRVVMPDRWMDAMIGSTVSANRSASLTDTARPFAAASALLVWFPSLMPVVLREARAGSSSLLLEVGFYPKWSRHHIEQSLATEWAPALESVHRTPAPVGWSMENTTVGIVTDGSFFAAPISLDAFPDACGSTHSPRRLITSHRDRNRP